MRSALRSSARALFRVSAGTSNGVCARRNAPNMFIFEPRVCCHGLHCGGHPGFASRSALCACSCCLFRFPCPGGRPQPRFRARFPAVASLAVVLERRGFPCSVTAAGAKKRRQREAKKRGNGNRDRRGEAEKKGKGMREKESSKG